jgi:hypothetical protein
MIKFNVHVLKYSMVIIVKLLIGLKYMEKNDGQTSSRLYSTFAHKAPKEISSCIWSAHYMHQ